MLVGGVGAARTETPAGIVDIYTSLGYQGSAAAGTGIILSGSGVVLTNNHVIRGATTIKATVLDTGRSYKAKVLGYALGQDVAVIQLQNVSGLQAAPLGHSSDVRLNDAVTAWGNAGGIGGATSAAGKIVGLGRSITASDDEGTPERLTGLIETDAQLQPGDSGGPLVDAGGHVIAMDTAAGNSFTFDSSANRGFAIPIDRALAIAKKIVAGQPANGIHLGATAFMGVSVRDTGNSFYFDQNGSGVIVSQILPGSPIARLGINPGDVITAFDGKTINTSTRLTSLVATKSPGDAVKIRWIDQYGQAHVATLKLASGPPQ
jgi:S1-C subfamily serine protease